MLRENLKLIELLSLCGVAATQVGTIGVNRFSKVIIDRDMFMDAQWSLDIRRKFVLAIGRCIHTLESESALIL